MIAHEVHKRSLLFVYDPCDSSRKIDDDLSNRIPVWCIVNKYDAYRSSTPDIMKIVLIERKGFIV